MQSKSKSKVILLPSTFSPEAYFEQIFDHRDLVETKGLVTAGADIHDSENDSLQCLVLLAKNPIVDVEKFLSFYTGFEKVQSELSRLWLNMTKNSGLLRDLKKKKLKHLFKALEFHIRLGIPFDRWRDVILPLFQPSKNLQLEYEAALSVAFDGKVPTSFKNVPLFSHSNELNEVLILNFLSPQGVEEFKKLMWVFEKSVLRLEYNPMLPQLVQLLLASFSVSEVFCIVKNMFWKSKQPVEIFFPKCLKNPYRPNWYLTFTKEEYKGAIEIILHFIEFRGQGFSKIRKHFKKIKFDLKVLCAEVFQSLLLDFLPLSVVFRIFGAYLTEGVSVYYQVTLAMLKIFQDVILNCKHSDAIVPALKDCCNNQLDAKKTFQLLTLAYKLKVQDPKREVPTTKFENPFTLQEGSKPYFPVLSETSENSLISSQHFETIWEWFPLEMKLTKPILAYSSKIHGWSLNTLYFNSKEMAVCHGMLLLIRAGDCVAFGAYVDAKFGVYQGGLKPKGTNETFMFQLEPFEKVYRATGKNDIHLICDGDYMSFGAGGNGPAIYLKNDLSSGFTNACETYGNEPLNFGDHDDHGSFNCVGVEVYWIR